MIYVHKKALSTTAFVLVRVLVMDILRNLTNLSGHEPDWLKPSLQLLLDIVVPGQHIASVPKEINISKLTPNTISPRNKT